MWSASPCVSSSPPTSPAKPRPPAAPACVRDEGARGLWYARAMTTGSDTPYLFVYGTLMSGAHTTLGIEERLRLASESSSLGPASLAGVQLYELGEYPGALPTGDIGAIVHGEAVLLSAAHGSFEWLDEYEGFAPGADDNEYDRVVRQVRLAGGETIDAWVYLLRRVPSHARAVVSGRWAAADARIIR